MLPGPPPQAVVVDLDDTVFPQAAYLDGAARAVGRAGAAVGLDGPAVTRALRAQLRAAFIGYRPRRLPVFPRARTALTTLRARYPLACVTDGNPAIQRAKLAATGVADAFDTVVITDELGGRAARKPCPDGLRRAAELLGVPADLLVVIGDRPGKDMAAAAAVGARSIRVRTGEYADAPDEPPATATAPDLAAAAAILH